jgi:hypothetical protein
MEDELHIARYPDRFCGLAIWAKVNFIHEYDTGYRICNSANVCAWPISWQANRPFLCDADAATSPAGAASPIICLADPRMGGRMKKMRRFSPPDLAVLPTSGAGGMWGGHHVRLRPLGFCHLHMIFEMIFCSLSFMCV